jgi:WD40 repeat protein
LATGDTDLRVRLWNPDSTRQVLSLIAHDEVVRGIAFRPDGQRLATTGDDKTAKIWRVSQTEFHDNALKDVTFSPDGQAIATASEDGTVRVWDATTLIPLFPPLEHTNAIVSRAAFNPVPGQRAYLASVGGNDRTVKVWTAGGTLLWEKVASAGDGEELDDVAFSSDGTRVATASRDHTARIWDSTTGDLLRTSPDPGGWVGAVAFSPVEPLLAAGDSNGKVMLWRYDTQQTPAVLQHSHLVDRLTFSPDGKLLATATTDGVVTVWDVTSGAGTEVYRWHAHAGRATTVAFSRDGALLATAGDDHVAKIWDLANGEVRQTLTHDVGVNAVAFSPDQKRLATAGEDHSVHVYPLELTELMTLAEQHVSRSLSNDECESYLHEQTCPVNKPGP